MESTVVTILNCELVRMWREVAVVCFKALLQQLPGGTQVKHEKTEDSRPSGRETNQEPHKMRSRSA